MTKSILKSINRKYKLYEQLLVNRNNIDLYSVLKRDFNKYKKNIKKHYSIT